MLHSDTVSKKLQQASIKRTELQKITYLGKEVTIDEFKDKSITSDMLSKISMNSYARAAIYAKLTDVALIEQANYSLNQLTPSQKVPVTYEEALVHSMLPELIARLEQSKKSYLL